MMIYTDVNDVSMYKIDCHKIQVTTERKMNNLRGQRFRFTALETSVSHAKGIFKLRKNRLIIPRWLPEMSNYRVYLCCLEFLSGFNYPSFFLGRKCFRGVD